MALRDVLPDWSVAVLFAALWVSSSEGSFLFWSRFDNRIRTYVADILSERQGPNFAKLLLGDTWFALVVTVAYALSWLFVVAFLIAYAYDGGWLRAVGLLLIAIAAYTLYSVCAALLGADEPSRIVGTVATVLTLALILALAFQVTWFGLRIGSLA